MTIDELRARKRELLARKRYELELQARGEGDNLALFMVREELGDVNDQLRALTAGRRQRGGRTAAADYTKDRQQYLDWRREDTALDGEIGEGRARLAAAAVQGLDLLTPRQREMIKLYLDGQSGKEIAALLGVNKSTVSRSIAKAKKKLREEAERAMTEARLRGEEALVDLANPEALRAVMLAMTPKQTVYFYLYYSECLSLREIGELTGTDHAAICRTLRRALRNVSTLLGGAGHHPGTPGGPGRAGLPGVLRAGGPPGAGSGGHPYPPRGPPAEAEGNESQGPHSSPGGNLHTGPGKAPEKARKAAWEAALRPPGAAGRAARRVRVPVADGGL